MQEVSLLYIKNKAHELHEADLKWHFHILTPTCKFNKRTEYAFVLECSAGSYVHYSNKAEKVLGKELVPLLHGSEVLKEKKNPEVYKPSEEILKIVQLAKEMNDQGEQWHHHVLFPDCIYNSNSPKFTFIFEGAGQVLENITDTEPKDDIKLIEPLFFKTT